eukprot:730634_1
MSDPQSLYDSYVEEYGITKQPNHLIAYAKKSGVKLKFSDARQIITKNATNSTNNNKTNKSSNKSSNKANKTTTNKWPPVKTLSTSDTKTVHIHTLPKSETINSSKTKTKTKTNKNNKPKSKWSGVKTSTDNCMNKKCPPTPIQIA